MKQNFQNESTTTLTTRQVPPLHQSDPCKRLCVLFFFCSYFRGHVVGRTPRFDVRSQAVRAELAPPPCQFPGSTAALQTLKERQNNKCKNYG